MKPACLFPCFLAGVFSLTGGAAEPDHLPGLVVEEFPRHRSQSEADKSYVEPEKFGKALDAYLIRSLDGWKHETERNAIASGLLLVPKTGTYSFRTNSFYDRNQLRIDGKIVCHYMDGGERVKSVKLKKGLVPIESIGFVNGRGGSEGIRVEWQGPGDVELGPIPAENLFHRPGKRKLKEKVTDEERSPEGGSRPDPETTGKLADSLVLVMKDFVTEIYHNGRRLQRGERKMVLDRFGATVERVTVDVMPGDWLVFHVANNRLRHGGTKYFGLSALLDGGVTLVSRVDSEHWSSCDHPAAVHDFIHHREAGTQSRAVRIAKPWEEGRKFMQRYSGHPFEGDPIWGTSPSTWIKLTVPEPGQSMESLLPDNRVEIEGGKETGGRVLIVPVGEKDQDQEKDQEKEKEKEQEGEVAELAVSHPKRWPVQVISAVYGTGGKNADVTEKVREYVEEKRCFFAANPRYLGVDPNPYWNKGLRIVYLKDGVRREQRRNENEHILPESFYGPQDAGEVERWILGTRWRGPRGEVQFHVNGRLAGPGLKGEGDWKAISATRLEIQWPGEEKKTEYRFDYVWSSFRVASDAKNEYRILK